MRLVYPEINHVFDTEIEGVNTIVIENPKLLYEFISDISAQQQGLNGQCIVSENVNKILSISKCVELITSFVPFEINQKPLLNKVQSKFEQMAIKSDYYEKYQELLGSWELFLDEIAFSLAGNITFSNLGISTLIKSCGLRFADEYDGLAEKLIDYIELVTEYDREKLYILLNVRSFINADEMELLIDTILRRRYNVIFIENVEHQQLKHEYRYIIDKDLCEI